jgi:hypothetical protein
MSKVIDLNNHPKKLEKEELEYLESQCDLLNGVSMDCLLNCYGYPGECSSCEVVRYNSKARNSLFTLILKEMYK